MVRAHTPDEVARLTAAVRAQGEALVARWRAESYRGVCGAGLYCPQGAAVYPAACPTHEAIT